MRSSDKRTIQIIFIALIAIAVLASPAQADTKYAYTYIRTWGACYIKVKSISSNNYFDVRYTDPIGPESGDTLIIIFDNNEHAKTIVNQRTGKAATVTSFSWS